MKHKNSKTIVLVSGDTGGPMAPLLALADTISKTNPGFEYLVIGTKWGVEARMAKLAGLPFVSIRATKLNRFFSLKNLFVPILLFISLIQSYVILKKVRPVCIVGAGSFVQVPVMYTAWLMGIPVFIHQQDVVPGLANKLCAPIAKRITVSFEKSLNDFPQGLHLGGLKGRDRVVWTGNPCRKLKPISRESALEHFGLDKKYPTVLVLGGGGGALSLNKLVDESVKELTRYMNVLHITGKGRNVAKRNNPRYKAIEFVDDMAKAYSAADLVFCRTGMGTITELASLKLPMITVPLPGSHQEQNALYLREEAAAIVLTQTELTPQFLVAFLRNLIFKNNIMPSLGHYLHKLMPEKADEQLAKIILESI